MHMIERVRNQFDMIVVVLKSLVPLGGFRKGEIAEYEFELGLTALYFQKPGYARGGLLCNFTAFLGAEYFKEITTWVNGASWSLTQRRDQLILEARRVSKGSYQFEYHWLRESTGSGMIRWMRIEDLTENLFANYSFAKGCWEYGNDGLLQRLPSSLEGQNAILGQAIPHTIDFDAQVQTMVEACDLEGFLATVQAHQNEVAPG